MKVLTVLPGLGGTGGVANYYQAVLPHLKVGGHVDIETLEVGTKRSAGAFLHPVLDQLRFYLAFQRTHPDIVHINPTLNLKCYFRDGLFIKIAKAMKRTVMVFFRGWDPSMETLIESKYKSFFDQTYAKADYFIVLSSRFKNRLKQWGIKAPIEVLTTAVDDELLHNFSIDRKVSRITQSLETKLLFLSRVEREKGVFETIEALRILLNHGYRVSLTIAGTGGASNDLQRYLEQHQDLLEQVHLLGYVRGAEKRSVLQSHDILSLPTSHHEGLPTAVLEAMAFGMPVLTRPVGGIADFFEPGKMGLLIQEKTPEVIAQHLGELIRDKSRRIAIARYNHHYATTHFLASKSAQDLLSAYHQIRNQSLASRTGQAAAARSEPAV